MTKTPLRLMAVGVVAALAAAACGGSGSSGGGAHPTASGGTIAPGNLASAPGVTATTVTIGTHQPLTGVAAPGYDEIAKASQAYFDFVNANGGVNGRTITDTILDDAYDPSKTVTDVHQLVLQDKVFAIFNGLGTPTHEAVLPFLNQQKVPDLFVASGSTEWNQPAKYPYTFGWQPDYTVEGKILGNYVKTHFAGKKIGIFAQNDDFGKSGIKGFEDEIPASQIAKTEMYDPTNIKVGPEAAALQQAGAQVVICFTVPAFTALLQLTALQLKFAPQLVVSTVGSDPLTLSGLLTSFSKGKAPNARLIQGIITDGYLASPANPHNSWIELFNQVRKQYDSGVKLDGNVEYGMAAAYTFVQALQAAGQNPTRASLIAAVEKGGFTGPGLTPFAFSSTDHSGYTGTEMGVIKGFVIKPLGKPQTTDDGNGPIVTYTSPQPTAPSNGIPAAG